MDVSFGEEKERCEQPRSRGVVSAPTQSGDAANLVTRLVAQRLAVARSDYPTRMRHVAVPADNQFRMSILERLEQMERRMAEMTAAQQQKPMAGSGEGSSTQVQGCAAGEAGGSFEERIIAVCEHMMASACWGKAERLVHAKSFRGMTLLHLAAAQGYTRLIQTLIKWRSHHTESIDLEFEVDPLNVDHFSCTPLMWACALGHVDAAVVLYQWNSRALSIPDSLGRLPLSVAHARGHVRLAACLDELQRQQGVDARPPHRVEAPGRGDSGSTVWSTGTSTQDSLGVPSPSFSQLSTSPDTGLSVLSSSVSSPTISDTRSPLSTHSSHGSPEQDSPLPSPDVATSQAFVSPIPAFPSSRSDPLPFAADRSGPPTAGVFAVSGTPLPANGATAAAAAGGFASRPSGAPSQRDEEMEVSSDTSAQAQAPVFLFPMAPASAARELERGSAQREAAEREMAEAELLSYSENLENEAYLPAMEVLQVDMITLAEQIIQATPERIKQENFTPMDSPLRERQGNHAINQTMAWLAGYLGDVDHLPNLSQHRSLYNEPLTPASNTSQSPVSSPLNEIAFERVETPTAADWSAFLNASTNGKMENEFSQLTLSDHEQRELYEAAKIIQTAFRKYKEQQDMAAAVIQRCYRKYKQYALYKKMTQAAILIQSKFRSYYEQKRFQQSRRAAVLIQQYYRSYKEYEKLKQTRRGTINLQQKMRGSFLSKNQDQAARKIMRFLRRSRHRMKELKQAREVESPQKHSLTT